MILTCPECASRYFVDDSKVGRAGRVVRCASCGARWTARNDEAVDLFEEPSAATLAAEPAMAALDSPSQSASASADRSAAEPEPPVSALPGEELPKVFRARADAERRLKEAKTTGIVWGGMVAAMVVILMAAGVFRMNVARLWPQTAGAYAFARMPVNNVGLVIEGLKAEPTLEDGHAALRITGVMRNITDRAVTAPPLRVSLFNAKNKRVAGKIAAAADPLIPPNQTRHFAVTLIDAPSTAKDLEVGFALEPGAAGAVKSALKGPAHGGHEGPTLRGAQHGPAHVAPEAAAEAAAEAAPAAEGAGHHAPGHETGAAEPAPAAHH